jgi:nitrogen fixation protein FixH
VLIERRAQAALGWRVGSELAPNAAGARLLVSIEDRTGAPVEGATVSGVLRWAPSETGDRALSFVALGRGLYAADLGALTAGRWDLRARAEDASGQALDFEAELTWPLTR